MPNKNDCWGIEVGANALKAVHLTRKGDDVTLADFEVLPFKKILTTPDLDVDEAIQVNLNEFIASHKLNKSTVLVSVPGNQAFARFAKLPPVEPKRIPAIVKFEAVQQIPFPIEEVEWDYQIFAEEDSPDVEVGIFAITQSRVSDILENYNDVQMRVDGLTLSPLAVYNALSYDLEIDEDAPGMIVMDIGAASTDVIIIEGGKLWLRTLPIGGNNFTEALVRSFKLSFPKAEKLKREARTSKYARQIFQAMRPVFAELVQELQRSLGFYQSINRDAEIDQLVGIGSTFRLPGMTKFLRQQLQLEVIRPDGFKRVEMDAKKETEFSDHAINMMTAYGLALQGLELEQVTANLMPKDVLKRRLWNAKQPAIAIAAGVMFAASATAMWTQRSAYSEYESTTGSTDSVVADAERVAGSLKNEWNQVREATNPSQQIANLEILLDYRTIWTCILDDLNEASKALGPQPQLVGNDYEAIATLDREVRRRIYIKTLSVEYVPGSGGATTMFPAPDDEGVIPARPAAPRFRVTIQGHLPHRRSPELVEQLYRRWLIANANRPDRPYRVLVNTLFDTQDMRPAGRREVADANKPVFRPGVAAVGGSGNTGLPDAAPKIRDISFETLLPRRPLALESTNTDWRFEFSWEIELLSPREVRQSEKFLYPTVFKEDEPAPEDGNGEAGPDTSASAGPARDEEAEG